MLEAEPWTPTPYMDRAVRTHRACWRLIDKPYSMEMLERLAGTAEIGASLWGQAAAMILARARV